MRSAVGGPIRAAVRAEWTKLRTTGGPAGLLLAAAALTVALGALVATSTPCTAADAAAAGCDAAKLSLSGVQLGQAVVAVLAVLVVGNEYGSGMIRTSLIAVPRRPVLLFAKAVVLVGPVLAAGAVAVGGSLAVGRAALPLSLGAGPTVRAAVGSVLYLGLVGLLSLGVAATVRDSATAIGVVLGLLYVFPIAASVVTNPHWHRRVMQAGPSTSGLDVQVTVGLRDLPLSPWAGLGVLALWAAGALLLGGAVLQRRDA